MTQQHGPAQVPCPSISPMSRRRFLGAAGASLLALPGCRAVKPSGSIELRFWNGFTGPDGRTMLRLVKRFNESQHDVRVSMQRIEWAIYYNKLLVAGLDGRAPDVFVSHASAMARLAEGGFLSPVDDLLAADRPLAGADFDANVLAAVRRDGQTWGVPLDVHPIGMYYNRKLLLSAGLRHPDGTARPPSTGAGFVEALRRLRRPDPRLQDNVWGFVFTWLRTNVYSAMRQWGGDIFAANGRDVILDSDSNAAALEYLVELIREEDLIARPQDGGGFIGFRQGRVGMVFEGIYMLSELRRQSDLDFGAAPLPQLGPRPAAWADSHVLCIPSELAPQRRAAAGRFVAFLSDNALDWAEAGQVPVRPSQRHAARFQAMEVQRAFARQLGEIAYLPRVPFVLEYQTVFDQMAERALRGSAPPRTCLKDAANELRRLVDLYEARRRRA